MIDSEGAFLILFGCDTGRFKMTEGQQGQLRVPSPRSSDYVHALETLLSASGVNIQVHDRRPTILLMSMGVWCTTLNRSAYRRYSQEVRQRYVSKDGVSDGLSQDHERNLRPSRLLSSYSRDWRQHSLPNAHTCEIRFDGLTYIVEKLAGSTAIRTVGAQCLQLASIPFMCCREDKKRVKLHVLKNLHGCLSPGRLTLLLGPPGEVASATIMKVKSKILLLLDVLQARERARS
jgi:hypothetical protein